MSEIFVWIFLSLAFTGGALIWRNKRRFNRTNEHGVQQYDTYGGKVKAEAFDKLLLVIAYVGATAATVMLLASDPEIMAFALVGLLLLYWVRRRA
jgi:hypothetical protein